MEASRNPSPRTLLVMGRVSNLPTVWSNVLCGWLLGGGGSVLRLLAFALAASALYVGGMYLNDAFDADFDRQHRRERPIPSGAIDEALAWRIGGALLASGTLLASCLGWSTALLAVLLALSILLYDAVHKAVAFSPVIMASCRLLLLLGASSTGNEGVTGIAIWASLVLAGWIVGLSYVARRESVKGPMAAWPLAALALPAVLALIVLDGDSRARGLLWTAVLLAWAGKCLVHVFHPTQRNLGRGVSGLLAGICLVDLVAAGAEPRGSLLFVALFAASLLAQRFIPAT
jgi:4-hydroxybenzoate polyprenyltransferase